jgi:2-oxoisovalerate dehydrogenase E2 component (dihydrolipoyl transacylase)
MNIFRLPDLGEGLQEAELVEWRVAAGEDVKVDQPLVAVETAKAVVEIPSPQAGRVERLFASAGDVIRIGAPLVGFEGAGEDTGSVVGAVQHGSGVVRDQPISVGHVGGAVRATPAVRALARKLNVDLGMVTPSGPDGLITTQDIERVARILSETEAAEPLRGVRRAMAHNMAQAQAEVAAATIVDDADINAWAAGTDTTIRLIRALAQACKAEPALNAWFESHAFAVDLSDEGLFVPVLRDVGNRDAQDLRKGLDRMRQDAAARRIPPEELRGATIMLSNFGMIAGRYAAPIVLPPTVAILGAGRIRDEVVAADGAPAVHRILPLSLTFDHRVVTGGEAGRFLAAVIADLTLAS